MNSSALRRPLRLFTALLVGWLVSSRTGAAPAPAPKLTPQQADFFEKKIRPVLVKECYKCHSAEGGRIKGGLRVDTRDGLLKGGDSGPAIVPGNPDASSLIRAIRYRDRNLQMPPDDKKLPASQIADLETWVRMGAPDPRADAPNKYGAAPTDPKQHWSFQPVFKPIVPDFRKDWALARNAIDHYVFATLEAKQLAPSPRADKITLIRRATFNLTGLPPTLQEVDDFLADNSEQAFEKVIDRLLASPRYGERWGRHWLDVARYGDTTGRRNNNRGETRYLHSHTYRDWVIKSFNDDLPFDLFAKLQIAGDRIVEEAESKAPSPNPKAAEAKPQTPDPRPQTPDPRPQSPSRSDLAALGFITLGPRLNNNADDLIDDRIDVVAKGFMALSVTCARCHDHKFDPIPTKDYYALHGVFASLTEPREGVELPSSKDTPAFKEFQKALAESEDALKKFEDGLRARARGELVGRISDYLKALYDFSHPTNTASLNQFMQRRNLLPAVAAGWKDALDKAKTEPHPVLSVWHDFAALPPTNFLRAATPVALRLRTPGGTNRPVNPIVARALSSPPGSIAVVATNLARLFNDANARWFQTVSLHESRKRSGATNLPPAPTGLSDPAQEEIRRVIYDPASPAYLFAEDKVEASLRRLREMGNVRDQQQRLARAVDDLRTSHPGAPPRAVVIYDSPQPRDSYVFIKGNRGSRGPNVPRQFLEILSGEDRQPFRDGSGRLELANHIASPDNPLTARVMVNRVWLHQFGEGIVRTANDFGLRAEPPTHPELLDYLAWSFMENGWSVKKLQKLILLSHTWQQSSEDIPRFSQMDPENRWLWQQNRRRLEFEALRDTILHIGGKLDFTMGGPGERLDREPYSDRRSVYGLVDRANLPGMFPVFDFANPDLSTGQRNTTVVPQQALFMMNSPLVVEQAINTVQRGDLKVLPNDFERVKMLYRLIYSRPPTDTELKLALNYLVSEMTAPRGPLPGQPPWEYGVGSLDNRTGRVAAFWPLPYNSQSRFYQGAARLPDSRSGNLHLSAGGGHPGLMLTQSIIRRWTALDDMLVSIESSLAHTGTGTSDGVTGHIIYSGAGNLMRGVALKNEVAFNIPRLRVTAGETIDFVVDCRAGSQGDTFTWAPIIKQLDPAQNPPAPTGKQWNARQEFGPPSSARRLYPWEKLAQVLLETNELTFVN